LKVSVRSFASSGCFLLIILASISWTVFHAHAIGATVTASWAYDYGPQPACAAPVDVTCIDHFEVQDISDQLHMSLVKEVANPSPATGKVDRISVSFKYGPPFGVRTISVIAVGRDAHGARVTSNPFAARQSITIWPFAKSSLLF